MRCNILLDRTGGVFMIIYKNILEKLKENGWNTGRIRTENVLPQSVLQRIRDGRPITTETLDTLCRLCSCNVEDLIEYKEGSWM